MAYDSHYIVNANTKLYLKLNGDLTDSSGNGNNGTNNGVSFTDGLFGQGGNVNGTSGYVTITDSTSLGFSSNFTLSTWVKFSSLGSNKGIIGKWDNQGGNNVQEYVLRIGTSPIISFNIATSSGNKQLDSSTGVSTGVWYNVVVTYNGTNLVMYRNGSVDSSTTHSGTINNGTSLLDIGTYAHGAGNFGISGIVDEIIIENSSWTSQQVLDYYNNSKDSIGRGEITYLQTANTKIYMPLNTNCLDISGNGNNGTPSSVSWVNGVYGQAGSFNGSTSKISCGNIEDETGSSPFTLSCWVNFSGLVTNQMIFGKQLNSGNFSGYILWYQYSAGITARLNMTLVSSSNSAHLIERVSANNILTTGVWYHIVATYSGSKTAAGVKLYLNGNLLSTTAVSDTLGTDSITSTADFGFGSRNSGNLPLNGLGDEIIKENTEWTAKKVMDYYSSTKGYFTLKS